MYADNELLFPPYVTPQLRHARGQIWRDLVERVSSLPEDHPERLAFSYLMIRLDGCLTCETDSYRAMRGCRACALQALRRFKGSDEELLERHARSLKRVMAYLEMVDLATPVELPLSVRAA